MTDDLPASGPLNREHIIRLCEAREGHEKLRAYFEEAIKEESSPYEASLAVMRVIAERSLLSSLAERSSPQGPANPAVSDQ